MLRHSTHTFSQSTVFASCKHVLFIGNGNTKARGGSDFEVSANAFSCKIMQFLELHLCTK